MFARILLTALPYALAFGGPGASTGSAAALGLTYDRKGATEFTAAYNREVAEKMAEMFKDKSDFNASTYGKIATLEGGIITAANGQVSWDTSIWNFLDTGLSVEEYPDTVNPSLYRQSALNAAPEQDGLFKVVDGLYQVRGYDLSVMSVIEGETGYILVDPLIGISNARAALKLVRDTLGDKPVTGVMFTHSHADHFGGAAGLFEPDELTNDVIAPEGVAVIAPEGFLEEAISENVMAGNAMSRRASYMYGNVLDKSNMGTVGTGLGSTTSWDAGAGLLPTITITEDGEEHTVDGITMQFLLAQGTEAPSEYLFYIPSLKALCMSEVTSRTLHNLQTLRGAKPRSGILWGKAIQKAIDLWGGEAEVNFNSHHWPTWGKENVLEYLEAQRDLYRFQHDQALRLLNQGYTSIEIANTIQIPDSIGGKWYNRPYYGTYKHNTRAQYDLYMGWYDGVPAHLDPLPPMEAGKEYVKMCGGIDNCIKMVKESYDEGKYRWVAEIANKIVFGYPDSMEARALLADAYEQLGYQAESGPWRNIYLAGATELRNGVDTSISSPNTAESVMLAPLDAFLDFMAVHIVPERADGVELSFVVELDEMPGEATTVGVKNNVQHTSTKVIDNPDFKVSGSKKNVYAALSVGDAQAMLDAGEITFSGDMAVLEKYLALMEPFEYFFDIVS